jgi:hypothetical protein
VEVRIFKRAGENVNAIPGLMWIGIPNGAAPSPKRVSARSGNDPLRVTGDKAMMVVVLFFEVMAIHTPHDRRGRPSTSCPDSIAGPTEAASLGHFH